MTRRRTKAGSSGLNEAHLYPYMDDHFSRLNVRLDAIDVFQQKHAQDQKGLICWQMEFDRRYQNLEQGY